MAWAARDYREDLDALNMISEDKRRKESQRLKLQIAGQCLAGILANNSEYNMNATNEQLAKSAWDVATELVKLSKKEEEEKKK